MSGESWQFKTVGIHLFEQQFDLKLIRKRQDTHELFLTGNVCVNDNNICAWPQWFRIKVMGIYGPFFCHLKKKKNTIHSCLSSSLTRLKYKRQNVILSFRSDNCGWYREVNLPTWPTRKFGLDFLFFVCGIARVYADKMPSTDAFIETANIYHGSSWNSVKDFLQYFSSLGYRTTVIFVL